MDPTLMEGRTWGELIKRRWAVLLSVWAVVMCTSAVVTALLPRQYLATASLVLDIKPDPIG